ncbi:hypothetical protein SAMN05892883_3759 [Jatrophihabitans sp. GAS493]|uniref:DUF6457 domain-containing protein n=1 Tax=Jatrophihabitans sp. GAS493 TaxID=1907575 RepID=UPI000BB815D1|nr:DUF6457 domain-containing protein [Jatrophihabitans sp. GAS493]SOD74573.1 hypothetical protein SAMN05892883_3759 [Jatrophihabitans sp. GAS493]
MTSDDWLARVAADLGVEPLAKTDDLLDLTREIAHSLERRFGPLTLFLLGQAVAAGGDRDVLVARLRAMLPAG